VAHAGTHEVSVIDRVGLHGRLSRTAAGIKLGGVAVKAEDVPNDLAFLAGLRVRRALRGLGPRGLVVSGGRAWVAEYFSDSVGSVDLGIGEVADVRSAPIGPRLPMTAARKGEFLFFDATACFQHWQSCGSCHPDARTDGLNWDLLNDGIGNPKQTKSMLFAHRMSPVMISGVRANAEVAVRAGLKFIQFEERPESDAKAIDFYLKSLKPVPSPLLLDGKLGEAAQRGKSLFARAGCVSCHSGPLFTDMKRHNVGTGVGIEKGKTWVTPTLVEVWRTAPYLYDGRSATMMDVLTRDNPGDRHGRTRNLTKRQLADLAAYVLSL
jgi:cytochrome c551/c552